MYLSLEWPNINCRCLKRQEDLAHVDRRDETMGGGPAVARRKRLPQGHPPRVVYSRGYSHGLDVRRRLHHAPNRRQFRLRLRSALECRRARSGVYAPSLDVRAGSPVLLYAGPLFHTACRLNAGLGCCDVAPGCQDRGLSTNRDHLCDRPHVFAGVRRIFDIRARKSD